jgi:hypothetical protein
MTVRSQGYGGAERVANTKEKINILRTMSEKPS